MDVISCTCVSSPSAPEASGTYVGTLDAKPDEQSTERLMPYAVGLTYAAANDSGLGQLLFLREGTLMAQPFDAKRLALAGDPVPVAERVGSFRDGGFFATSANDVLVYRTADTDSQVSWFDRQGIASGRVSEPGGFRGAAFLRMALARSRRAPIRRTRRRPTCGCSICRAEAGRTRLTLGAGIAEFPVWSPDGKRIVFTFNNNMLRQKLASGEGDEKELLRVEQRRLSFGPTGWSPDGRFLLYTVADVGEHEIWTSWCSQPTIRKPVPFMRTGFIEDQGRFSPNGRWVAYVSNQSGAE